jgi:hypothetical protein
LGSDFVFWIRSTQSFEFLEVIVIQFSGKLASQLAWRTGRRLISFVAMPLLLVISGCSFQSNQWEMVRALFSDKEELINAEWLVELSTGERFYAFALNEDGRTIFTDGTRWTLAFDGWHVTEFQDRDTGTEWRLSFMDRRAAIEKCPSDSACTLEYSVLKGRGALGFSTQNCESWRALAQQKGFYKRCDNGVDLTPHYQIDVSEGGLINRISWSFEGQSGVMSHLSERP